VLGCKLCEVACALKHTQGSIHKGRGSSLHRGDLLPSRDRGPFTEAGCNSKGTVFVDGKEVDGCVLCRASCPEKTIYKEPDTAIPLKCDFCGDP